jgi:hypothetical protein
MGQGDGSSHANRRFHPHRIEGTLRGAQDTARKGRILGQPVPHHSEPGHTPDPSGRAVPVHALAGKIRTLQRALMGRLIPVGMGFAQYATN